MNSTILKNIGQTKSPMYGIGGVDMSATPKKDSKIMANKNTASTRCGYGTMGVDAGSMGSGPKRSSNRAAGASPGE